MIRDFRIGVQGPRMGKRGGLLGPSRGQFFLARIALVRQSKGTGWPRTAVFGATSLHTFLTLRLPGLEYCPARSQKSPSGQELPSG